MQLTPAERFKDTAVILCVAGVSILAIRFIGQALM
jgi:hypothetical protein